MIYEKDGIVYFKNGSQYEIANISTPYNEMLGRYKLMLTGSGTFVPFEEGEEPKEISFKVLEKKLTK